METPLVSVLIPCYNQARFLPDALSCILAQTYHNWECIIVNDGSTDNTEEVALEWAKNDTRFKYIKTTNGGPSASRNIALKNARGEYFQFLDSDDVIDSKKIEIQIKTLSGSPEYALCVSDYFVSVEDNLLVQYPYWYLTPKFKSENYINELIKDWETKLSFPINCLLIKSNIFKKNNIFFDESLPNHVDWDLWMKIFLLEPKVYFVDQKLATYRIQSSSLCRSTSSKKGFLLALAKQKEKHKNNSQLYNLLSVRYNEIRFGVESSPNYPMTKINLMTVFYIFDFKLRQKIVINNPEISFNNSLWNSFKNILKKKLKNLKLKS